MATSKPQKYPPLNPKAPFFLHGGDYNPDQWFDYPGTWEEDMRLMKLSGCNAMSIGIFSWSQLEPEEGKYTFDWLDRIMDMLAENDSYAVLATPSGAKPAWMSKKYPEIRRVNGNGIRHAHGGRHNHCRTSPVYREKCIQINTKLAERYKDHPALLVWHVSNEYDGLPCYCDLCLEAFREWLRKRYNNDLDAVNHAWWTGFWSHRYATWDEIIIPDTCYDGMMLDWKRFITDHTVDFFMAESEPLRRIAPDVPITVNMMGTYEPLNYHKFAPVIDVASWDNYPDYLDQKDMWRCAIPVSFTHDIMRCLKNGQPFMIMESVPSAVQWREINPLKRPGLHRTEELQAIAHGADTVQYFQWRKGRGAGEKFHGAVVDHVGHENTRVFNEVAKLGATLKKLQPVIGSTVRPKVAIVFDWENRWALHASGLPGKISDYRDVCLDHYRCFWMRGIPVDVIDTQQPVDDYDVVIAPVLYMTTEEYAKNITAFVEKGGTFITTYFSGVVNETNLCHLGGFPGPLRSVLGIWAEESDPLLEEKTVEVSAIDTNVAKLNGTYTATEWCDLIHAETAEAVATYASEFYAGRPALTVNKAGKGEAWYIASRNDERFYDDFYTHIIDAHEIQPVIPTTLPCGVSVQNRTNGTDEFIFLLNFTRDPQKIDLKNIRGTDVETGEEVAGTVTLDGYGSRVIQKTL